MGREEAEPQHEPPYWTHDTSLCTGSFRSFGREPFLVRGKLHLADEPYRKSDVDLEIVPLAHKQGMSTYVNMRAYVLVPDITLTVDLYPTPRQSAAYSYIGKVAGAAKENPKMKEQEIGDGQAWYYPTDNLAAGYEEPATPTFDNFVPAPWACLDSFGSALRAETTSPIYSDASLSLSGLSFLCSERSRTVKTLRYAPARSPLRYRCST